jgi:hypothetical protein
MRAFKAVLCQDKIYVFAEVLNNWVGKSKKKHMVRRLPHLRMFRKSNKFADLRFAELICGPPASGNPQL